MTFPQLHMPSLLGTLSLALGVFDLSVLAWLRPVSPMDRKGLLLTYTKNPLTVSAGVVCYIS